MTTTAGTPADRVAILHRALVQAVRSDEFRERLQPLGLKALADDTPEALGAYRRAEDQVWQRIAQASGATLD
jgi:tripartite-type tricarboxylate transporter receptor subunit TctC